MQSAKDKVQQMALMAALKLKEPISIPVLYSAFRILQLIAQKPESLIVGK
jgi:hypothetical protein